MARTETIEAGASTIAYSVSVAERDGDGVPLVLIHGWGCGRSDWEGVVDALGPGHTTLALDLPAHGGSSSSAGSVSIGSYADDVAAAMDAEGIDRAVLVGHSIGGAVALEFAARHPERTIRVIGSDSFHYLQVYPKQDEAQIKEFMGAFTSELEAGVRGLVEMSSIPSTPERIKEHVRRSTLSVQQPLALTALEDSLRWDLDATLDRVAAPVSVIVAQELLAPEALSRYGQRMRFLYFPAVSHYFPLEDPAGTAALIQDALAG